MFECIVLRALNGHRKGQEFMLENEIDYTLGRARDCSCVVDDHLCLVSRRHCRISVHAPFVRIEDLGSRNGTRVNGALISPLDGFPQKGHAEHPLDDGDTLQIAGYKFQVEFEPALLCAASEPRDQKKLWSCDCSLC